MNMTIHPGQPAEALFRLAELYLNLVVRREAHSLYRERVGGVDVLVNIAGDVVDLTGGAANEGPR